MTFKKLFPLRTLEKDEAANLNQELDRLYSTKVESRNMRTTSGVESFIYQSMEHGLENFSATGSATVVRTFNLCEKHGKIVYATAHARSPLVTAHVTDVTQTAITIECRTVSGTAAFSAVTTASIAVGWQVLGASP